jgi:hypothetical protein
MVSSHLKDRACTLFGSGRVERSATTLGGVWFTSASDQGGKFLPNEGLDNDKLVSTEQAIKDGVPTGKLVPNAWDEAQKRPIDTPSRGSLKYG